MNSLRNTEKRIINSLRDSGPVAQLVEHLTRQLLRLKRRASKMNKSILVHTGFGVACLACLVLLSVLGKKAYNEYDRCDNVAVNSGVVEALYTQTHFEPHIRKMLEEAHVSKGFICICEYDRINAVYEAEQEIKRVKYAIEDQNEFFGRGK